MQPLEQEALVKEAASKGYGKLYAVFGGGLEGLRACAAGITPSFSPLSLRRGVSGRTAVLEKSAMHLQHGSLLSMLMYMLMYHGENCSGLVDVCEPRLFVPQYSHASAHVSWAHRGKSSCVVQVTSCGACLTRPGWGLTHVLVWRSGCAV